MVPDLPHFRELLIAFLMGARETWKRFTSEFAPGGLIDEATAEEKELAWMPATNDVNEGALGSFRVLMRRQPQLTLLGHNALAMYFRNDTEAFMAEKFTEKEDYQYLHALGRQPQVDQRKLMKEHVQFRADHQKRKVDKREKQGQRNQETAARLASTNLILDERMVTGLKGQALKDQLRLYQLAGAPNLQHLKLWRTKVKDIREALAAAVELWEDGRWKVEGMYVDDITSENDEDGSEEGEGESEVHKGGSDGGDSFDFRLPVHDDWNEEWIDDEGDFI